MTGDIYCFYFYVSGMFACFALKQGILGYKIKHFTAKYFFTIFSDKNLWFSSP